MQQSPNSKPTSRSSPTELRWPLHWAGRIWRAADQRLDQQFLWLVYRLIPEGSDRLCRVTFQPYRSSPALRTALRLLKREGLIEWNRSKSWWDQVPLSAGAYAPQSSRQSRSLESPRSE